MAVPASNTVAKTKSARRFRGRCSAGQVFVKVAHAAGHRSVSPCTAVHGREEYTIG